MTDNSFELGALEQAVKSGDPRRELEGIRDFLVQELEGHRCNSCMMSKLRTGDTASLTVQLRLVLAELKTLPISGEVSELDRIRARRSGGASGASPQQSTDPTQKRRTGDRRPGGGRRTGGD